MDRTAEIDIVVRSVETTSKGPRFRPNLLIVRTIEWTKFDCLHVIDSFPGIPRGNGLETIPLVQTV
jgi:hypothetical protein